MLYPFVVLQCVKKGTETAEDTQTRALSDQPQC